MPKGMVLSDYVFNELKSTKPERIPLSTAAFENFPYNIRLHIPSSAENKFFIAITQEDFWRHKNFVGELLEFAKTANLNCELNFVFTAGDNRKIPGNETTSGSQTFCRSIEGMQNIHALVLDFGATKKSYITPGSSKEVAPLYLIEPLCTRLDENSIDYKISGGIYLSLYKTGILKDEPRLAAFLSQGIPAVMFTMLSQQDNYNAELQAIKDFLLQIEFPEGGAWNRHYIPVFLWGKHFWISENVMLTIIMVFTSLCILILCDFMFLFRKRSRRLVEIKMRALKSNYLIFLTAIVLTLSLFAGQMIVGALIRAGSSNFVILFIIKISLPFLIVSIAYPFEIRLNNNLPPYIYEYILSISALLNIFIFTMIDISLFFLFAVEYLILALSRTVKRTVLLYFFMAVFLLPFIPLLYSILVYSDPQKIQQMIFCNARGNILLSFALVPLSLLWLRVLARLNSKTSSAKRTVKLYSIAIVANLVGIIIMAMLTTFILNKTFFQNVEPPKRRAKIEQAKRNIYANVSVYDTEYYGGKIRRIEISSKKEAERYSISIGGESANPVYFSIYETAENDGKTEFLLPENPPKTLTVIYTPDSSQESNITVEAFYMNEEKFKAEKETFIFDISGQEILERAK